MPPLRALSYPSSSLEMQIQGEERGTKRPQERERPRDTGKGSRWGWRGWGASQRERASGLKEYSRHPKMDAEPQLPGSSPGHKPQGKTLVGLFSVEGGKGQWESPEGGGGGVGTWGSWVSAEVCVVAWKPGWWRHRGTGVRSQLSGTSGLGPKYQGGLWWVCLESQMPPCCSKTWGGDFHSSRGSMFQARPQGVQGLRWQMERGLEEGFGQGLQSHPGVGLGTGDGAAPAGP